MCSGLSEESSVTAAVQYVTYRPCSGYTAVVVALCDWLAAEEVVVSTSLHVQAWRKPHEKIPQKRAYIF